MDTVGRTKAFAVLLARCPNLKVLDLDGPYGQENQDDSVLVSLAQHCPLVEGVHLTSRCSDAVLLLLKQNCKNLITFKFCECGGLTDAFFEHIVRIQSLQNLYFDQCKGITDAGLATLMRGCPNLRVLHFLEEDYHFHSAAVFRGLKDAPFVDSLVEINIYVDVIEDADEQFEVIIGEGLARCHNLVKVVVVNDHFGDVGLALMCAGCPKLEELEVRLLARANITIEGLIHVATKCPHLRRCEAYPLDIDFSDAEVEMFKARFPAIELFTKW